MDRVAVVTGAVGLLGRRHCRALARAGAHVVVADLEGEACAELAWELSSAEGPDACGHEVDVTAPDSVRTLAEAVLATFERIDILVNNAALDEKVEAAGDEPVAFEDLPLERWERALRVNLTGTFLCCQALGAEMARAGRGSIVNVASTYALVAPDQALYRDDEGRQTFVKSAAYPASKAGVLGLTRYLAAYWGRAGVRVNALSPGGVRNGQDPSFVRRYAERTPLGRMAEAGDYEGALVFLAGEASAYMTGANLVVDGGWTAW